MQKAIQIEFRDKRDFRDNKSYYGLLLSNGNILCGCCGCEFVLDDDFEIIYRYKNWVDLTDAIKGE